MFFIFVCLIKCYKCFFVDVWFEDGSEIIVYCVNSGLMMGLKDFEIKIWFELNDDFKKKLKYGWCLVDYENGYFMGVDILVLNCLFKVVFKVYEVFELVDYLIVCSEVKYGQNSRVDFLLLGNGLDFYVEVKLVILLCKVGIVEFFDSVIVCGIKYLYEFVEMIKLGYCVLMFYLV